MLSGDPNTFAIWFDPVESWSTDSFKNGSFAFFVGREILWSLQSTLGVDLNLLGKLHCIENGVQDGRLFGLPPVEAYSELCALAFPSMDSDVDYSDYTHLVSVGSLLDEGHNVFLIESGDQAKLIYGFNDDLSRVREVVLKRGEFQAVVADAADKWQRQ
jgi:hypothetical protein